MQQGGYSHNTADSMCNLKNKVPCLNLVSALEKESKLNFLYVNQAFFSKWGLSKS